MIAFPDVVSGSPYYYYPFDDIEDVGPYSLTPEGAETADGTSLTRNSGTMLVKYGSRLSAPVIRTSNGLTWAATATQWSNHGHVWAARPGVRVGLFHQASSTAAWTYVKSARTSGTGKVTIGPTSPKAGNYRLVVGETQIVWAAYSRSIAGRV